MHGKPPSYKVAGRKYVEVRFLKDFYAPGREEPLHRAGETASFPAVTRIAQALVEKGYAEYTGRGSGAPAANQGSV